MKPYYDHAGITIYHGDCRDVFPALSEVDLICTDPPYGLNKSWGKSLSWQGRCGKGRLWNGTPEWDSEPADIAWIESMQIPTIIWGGNYFRLSPQKGWLVWNKCADMTQAQAELAWTNCVSTVRVFNKSPLGVWGNGGANEEYKHHPTQKPAELMRWCLALMPHGLVLDPFMGSGTTLRAAKDLGRRAIGIELEEKYCEIAAKRMAQEVLEL